VRAFGSEYVRYVTESFLPTILNSHNCQQHQAVAVEYAKQLMQLSEAQLKAFLKVLFRMLKQSIR
jgi:hypothetical protein